MSDARRRAVEALIPAAQRYPDVPAHAWDFSTLPPRDAALAMAIHRTVMQRWITLTYLLDGCLTQKSAQLEPRLRAVLLAGAAQVMFLDRLPDHAVVDESVSLARRLVRPGAAGLVNAVLRKLITRRGVGDDQPWRPDVQRLPLGAGGLALREVALPPVEAVAHHLSVATSHPRRLVQRWIDVYGEAATAELCLHNVMEPPTVVHEARSHRPWDQGHDELRAWLAAGPDRWVQDAASSRPVEATAGLAVAQALDYCAGRGTKSRQLAYQHPQARILATDVDEHRFASLREMAAAHERIDAVTPAEALARVGECDLVVLDVPCSNTGVLARRPEARYRFDQSSLDKLINLQRQIVGEVLPHIRPGCHVLYATCSLEREENQRQVSWITAHHPVDVVRDGMLMPSARGEVYHDGSFHALLRRRA